MATGETVPCGSCRGNVRNKEFACAVHGKCVPATDCARCPDYARKTFHEITTRHLLYHIYPVRSNGVWRRNVELLKVHLPLFNGTRTVAVVTDARTDTPDAVRAAFGSEAVELLSFPNDPALREVATFLPLFERAAAFTDPTHATFYAQAKGVTRPHEGQIRRWVEALYDLNLARWEAVANVLRNHPVAGAFLKVGQGWPSHESKSQWHYSGSFYWIRNAELFSKESWTNIEKFWSGIEPYPSLHFSLGEAGCIFHRARVRDMNLYDANYWGRTVEPELEKWRRAGTAPPLAQPVGDLLVELGGGKNPRGAPWVNVDREPGADVVLDLERDPLPWPDASVGAVYSSHTLEHVVNLRHVLREIARVCRVGAAVEIRVPHWLSEMALCHDHKQTIGDEQVRHWCESAVDYWFGTAPRALRHVGTERVPSAYHAEASALFPRFTEEQLSRFVPDTFHENRYLFMVIDR